MTHARFIAGVLARGTYLSKLFEAPGFIYGHFSVDLMHAGDFGVLQYMSGVILYELVLELNGCQSNAMEQVAYLLKLIRQASKACHMDRPPINSLKFTMIKGKTGAPQLKVKVQSREAFSNACDKCWRCTFRVIVRRLRFATSV